MCAKLDGQLANTCNTFRVEFTPITANGKSELDNPRRRSPGLNKATTMQERAGRQTASALKLVRDQSLRRIQKLAEGDVVTSILPNQPLLSQIIFGLLCTAAGIALRLAIDNIWQGAGPFGLMVPAVLVATLFGQWQAGLTCLLTSSLYAWYVVLPIENSFRFEVASDGPRVIVNVLAGFFVVMLAELFRNTMRQALSDRELLLRELEHRVKNNFASVTSMLRLQMRQNPNDETVNAVLQSAVGRVESYALVNSFLYRDSRYTGTILMNAYLAELCKSLEQSVPAGMPVTVEHHFVELGLPRDRAIVFGLLLNEIVTNAVKHAFKEGHPGKVTASLKFTAPQQAVLEIADDGKGFKEKTSSVAVGLKLISALATQADAELSIESNASGTKFAFTFSTAAS